MKQRKRCQNKECGVLFTPCPQVPWQKYCSRKECQQVRKNEWNKKRLTTDSDYREARQAAQQRWKEKNPNYWKDYRASHPDYRQKNRDQQKVRNQKRQKHSSVSEKIVKTDESNPVNPILTGRYKIVPIRPGTFAKTDECIVEIRAVSG
jgi:FtsZ-interacting cell division protein YlmF